jgi:putative transposase
LECVVAAWREDVQARGIEPFFLEPGSPWENGAADSFHGKVWDERLGHEEFRSLLEARVGSDTESR